MSCTITEGRIKLADDTILKIVVNIIDARESGFSPFGGVNIVVKHFGGTAVVKVPDQLIQSVKDKPIYSSANQPQDGWEMMDIVESTNAIAETKIPTTRGNFLVRLVSQPSMASRNLNYKSDLGEPVYIVYFAPIVGWKPVS